MFFFLIFDGNGNLVTTGGFFHFGIYGDLMAPRSFFSSYLSGGTPSDHYVSFFIIIDKDCIWRPLDVFFLFVNLKGTGGHHAFWFTHRQCKLHQVRFFIFLEF
jgi:hypothetical protein